VTSPGDLTATLGVLSAMITPAVLILASGSLILTTSSRLIRAVDRVRDILPLMETLEPNDASRRAMLMNQLSKTTMRARMLQHTLSLLYTAIGLFVATSVSIGVIALLSLQLAWIPLLLGFLGAGLLFVGSMLLIYESRIAIRALYAEMDYITHLASSGARASRPQ
jgi:Protein of unknown function (DUF2721)